MLSRISVLVVAGMLIVLGGYSYSADGADPDECQLHFNEFLREPFPPPIPPSCDGFQNCYSYTYYCEGECEDETKTCQWDPRVLAHVPEYLCYDLIYDEVEDECVENSEPDWSTVVWAEDINGCICKKPNS